MNKDINLKPIEILLVEDNPGDVRLTIEALKEGKILNNLSVAEDGVEAMAFLHKEGKYVDASRPELILLDLNLPKKNGQEVLVDIKSDKGLASIPVVILTNFKMEEDILKTYENHANCYIVKPVDLDNFLGIVKSIESFWLGIVQLPPSGTK